MGILSSFFDVVAGVSILAGRSSLLDTSLTTIAGRNLTVRGALGLSFLSIGFINLVATSRKQKKIERLTKDAETFGADDEKVTERDTEFWLGSSNTVSEAVEVITSVANGEYKPKNLKEDILDIRELYGAEDEGRFYDELEEKIEAKEKEIRDFKEYLDKVGYGRQEIRELNSMEQELAELEEMEFKGAESFGAEREIHQLIIYDGSRADTLVFENPDDIKDYLYEGLHGSENLSDEKWYIDDDEAAERKKELGEYWGENNAGFDKAIDDINRKRFAEKTKNMSINEVIEFLHLDDVFYMKTLVDLDKDFRVNGEDGGIKQAAFKDDNHGYRAETFNAEREVYVLTFSDPMRNGKLVELPFLTYEEAQEYIEANIAPYNANKPFSQQIATRIIFPSEEYNAPAAVMRTYKGRKSPSVSAKSVKVGTRKRGNDGKMWQVRSVKSRGKRTQRWFKD